jgi:NADP-dependent 3-hydroxy acid dehydrogenase YdfG
MTNWIVTGASGSLASACIEVLLAKGKVVHGFSRRMVEDERISFKQVPDYHEIKFDTENCEGLLVAQGLFIYEHLDSMSVSEVYELVDANFLSQIHVLHSFLQQVNKNKRTNIIILGSTSAYEAGRGTVIYGAAKAGMLAFVKALNKEYIDTDIRFWFISTGTLANEMGAKVPNQDPNSLLDPALVAKRIIEAVTDESNLWEPEVTIRRRHIKLVN